MTSNNLCNSCTNIGCEFQSGIVRTECAFYMPPQLEPDNCGNYVAQEPRSDVISREAVLKLQYRIDDSATLSTRDVVNVEDIQALPPATPIRPKGHWIPIYQGDEIIDYRCSECEFGNTFGRGTFGMNFCSRCGSDNREVKE